MYCPKWYYTGTVSEENQIKIKELFEEFLSNDENFATPNNWNCTARSTYEQKSNYSAPWQEFLDLIKDNINEFMEEVHPQIDVEIQPHEAWANRYSKGEYQEYHTHSSPMCNISMVYFYKENENTHFRLCDNDHEPYRISGLSEYLSIPSGSTLAPKVGQGSILIFPSHYGHYVTPNDQDAERITFSANFLVMPARVDS